MTPKALISEGRADPADPFATPAGLRMRALREATGGRAPLLATRLGLWRDAASLRILFRSDDEKEAQSTYRRRDEPLYNEDVVEVFLSMGDPTRYVEIEVSPIGTIFDARVRSPDGVRSTMDVDSDWDCEGLLVATRRTRRSATRWCWETMLTIPFASLGADPRPGEIWTGNFYRIDRRADGTVEYSAWSPPLRQPADFHVVATFGQLQFEA